VTFLFLFRRYFLVDKQTDGRVALGLLKNFIGNSVETRGNLENYFFIQCSKIHFVFYLHSKSIFLHSFLNSLVQRAAGINKEKVL
jgi:hypothetical protein